MPMEFLKRLFAAEASDALPDEDARSAIAAVLVMAARADHDYADAERKIIDGVLMKRYGLSAFEAAALRTEGEAAENESIDIYKFSRRIKDAIPYQDRMAVLEALWRVILSDNVRDPHEDSLMRQMADRLGLSPMDLALARKTVQGGGAMPGM